MKVNVYVGGFNLYYRALRKIPGSRWLDLGKLADSLLQQHEIQRINYFTSRIRERDQNDQASVVRQDLYWRALRTIPNLKIHEGYFAEHVEEDCRLVTPIGGITCVDIIRTTEKGSDVNLATELLIDAAAGSFEGAAVITNDSDLCAPIKAVRDRFGLKVLVLDPNQKDGESKELKAVSTAYRRIRPGSLTNSQFPEVVHDRLGTIRRPPAWDPPPAPLPSKPEKS